MRYWLAMIIMAAGLMIIFIPFTIIVAKVFIDVFGIHGFVGIVVFTSLFMWAITELT